MARIIIKTDTNRHAAELSEKTVRKLFSKFVKKIREKEDESKEQRGDMYEADQSAAAVESSEKKFKEETAAVTDSGTEEVYYKYNGFLHIRCECGQEKTFCAKEEMTHFKCSACKKVTAFDKPLHRVNARCECGKHYGYYTNVTDETFDINCISCGAPMSVTWNEKRKRYEPTDQWNKKGRY